MKCAHMVEGRCTHPEASAAFGDRPSRGVCLTVCGEWSGPDRGLGDTVHRVLGAFGVTKAVERLAPAGGCGCAERRAALNRAVSFHEPT